MTKNGFNLLRSNDAIWRHRYGSSLTQAIACCLSTASHYLNKCWLIISDVFWDLPKGNFTGDAQDVYHWCEFEITNLRLEPGVGVGGLSWNKCVNFWGLGCRITINNHCISVNMLYNTLRPRQNGCQFADDIFKCIFVYQYCYILFEILLNFVSKGCFR